LIRRDLLLLTRVWMQIIRGQNQDSMHVQPDSNDEDFHIIEVLKKL